MSYLFIIIMMAVPLGTQILKDTPLAPGFNMRILAESSCGMSGSDLKGLCRNAAMLPVREFVRKTGKNKQAMEKGQLEVGSLFFPFLFGIRYGDFDWGFRGSRYGR